jgi:light-regulated signal transduction histidine kinase (bacteriophytochrome)
VVCDPGAISNSRVNGLLAGVSKAVPEIIGAANQEASQQVDRVTATATTAIEDLFHNIRTYNAKIRQAFNLIWREDPDASSGKIEAAIVKNPSKTLAAFRRALKSSALITAEMRAWEMSLGDAPRLRPLRIHRVVKAVTMVFSGDLEEKGVDVRWGRCEEEIYADSDAVITALTHLIDNTVKYICPDSPLVYEYEVSDKYVDLLIEQLSAYIHPEEREAIWTRGARGREASNLAPGKGTGLGTIREILERCGATIDLEAGVLCKVNSKGKFAKNIFKIKFPRPPS